MSYQRGHKCVPAVLLFCGICYLFVYINPIQAATFYVATDGNDSYTPTQAQHLGTPWRTLDRASRMVSFGDTVIVRGGIYYEEVVMRSDGVTWQAYPGETPIVDGSVALGMLQPLHRANDFLAPDGTSIEGRFQGNPNWRNIYKVTFPISDTSLSAYYMYRTMILEGDHLLAPSSLPQQASNLYDDHLTYTPINPGCYGETAFLTTSGREEPDGFWNGAVIKVYLRNFRNMIVTQYVTDWDAAAQRFTLSTPLPATLSAGDSYKLENHWGCLTRPGEIYVPQTAVGDYFTAYIWPETDNDLTDFRIAKHDCGWYFFDGNDDDIIVDGFTIQNFCGSNVHTSFAIGRPAAELNTMTNCRISNCTIRNIEGKVGIILGAPSNVIVENCTISNARTEWGIFSRGLSMNRGTDVIIRNCSVVQCRGTNYKFTETDYGQIRNCFIGESSTHGDGIAVYENCSHIGVFHCRAVNSAIGLAYQGVTNLYVVGNDFQTYWYSMAHWADSTGGDMIFLNNTMALAPGVSDLISAAGFQLAVDQTPGNYVVKNNIFWSTAGTIPAGYTTWPNTFERGYNCFLQDREHWTPGTGSFECTSPETLFADWSNPAIRDLTLKDPNAAIYQAGINVDDVLADVEAVFSARGSLFSSDMSADRNGTAWADRPSVGAYEYGGVNPVYNRTKRQYYATIQQAIADANDYNEIVVSPGIYTGTINFLGKSISVRSVDPNDGAIVETTVIDAGGLGRVVTFSGGEDANSILSGLTMTGGYAAGPGDAAYGGGIYCYHASPTIKNCIVKNAYADRYGGGMYAIHSSAKISNCLFLDNEAYESGGGLYNDANCVTTLMNCMFIANSANYRGAGIFNDANSVSVIINSLFSGNISAYEGGGVFNDANSVTTLIGCTFSGNSAAFHGGGMMNVAGDPNAGNCIFWGNSALLGNEIYNVASVPAFRHCNIAGSGGSRNWNPQIGKDRGGNIDSDPLFAVDSGLPGGSFRLSPGSPCIDAGDSNTVPHTVTYDLARRWRFVDDLLTADTGNGAWPVVDIGAYEYACMGSLDLFADVTLADFALFTRDWMNHCYFCSEADFDGDGKVTSKDMHILIENWLCGR